MGKPIFPNNFAFETKFQYSLLAALKFFKNSLNVLGPFLWVDLHGLYRIGLGFHGLGMTYLFGPFHYQLGPKIIFNVNNYLPYTICPMGHVRMY